MGRRTDGAALRGGRAMGGGADHAGRSPPAAQMRQPDLPPDVLRHVEIRPAPLVLDAAVRRPRQGPRVLPAPPGGHEPGGDSAPGSHTVNVLPAPGVESTVMWPPCSSASSRAMARPRPLPPRSRSEEHTSELQSQSNLVCRLLLEKHNMLAYRTGERCLAGGRREYRGRCRRLRSIPSYLAVLT